MLMSLGKLFISLIHEENSLKMKKKILVFSGAGVSAESGISTFRDSNGLWENHSIEEVATPQGWLRNPSLVLDFYNKRRAQLKEVEPNEAHKLIADLEMKYDVTVVTQNVDNLHERAGSSRVIHLHGELTKVRPENRLDKAIEWTEDLHLGDLCENGFQLRPHIVWFGEMLNEEYINSSRMAAESADVCIIIGTSLQVYPANEIPYFTKKDCLIYVIDPCASDLYLSGNHSEIHLFNAVASEGMKIVCEKLEP
jgi:NAD-dependent deacetylase